MPQSQSHSTAVLMNCPNELVVNQKVHLDSSAPNYMAEPLSPVFQFAALAPAAGLPQGAQSPASSHLSSAFGSPAAASSSFALSPSTSFVESGPGVKGPPETVRVLPDPTYPPCAANASVTMCPDDHKIFLFGGFDFTQSTDELFNSVILIDTRTFKASKIMDPAGTAPSGRHGHTVTYWKDGKLIIFGGENERGEFLNELYIFDLRKHTWLSPKTYGNEPIGRSRHAACLSQCGRRLYFCGGFRHQTVMSDIFCLDLDTMTWSSSRPFVARYDHVATAHSEKIWIFGGLTQDMDRPSDVTWFDLRTSAVASLRFDETATDYESDDSGRLPNGRPGRRGTPIDKRAGTHFYSFCGSTVIDFMTHGPAIHNTETSITSFNLTELRWRTLADASCDIFSGNSWAYVALSGTTAYLLGSPLYSDNDVESDVLCRVLPIDLKYYGAAPKLDTPNPTALLPESLNADISTLFNDRESSDFIVTAIPDDSDSPDAVSDPIYVHTLILTTRWPHFKRLANSRMREYHRKRLHIPEKHSTVSALLYYLYSDSIASTVQVDLVARLLVLSNMYALQRLRDLCLVRIQDQFDVANAPTIWECAKLAQEDVLRSSAARFCLKHWGRVVRTKAFRALSKNALVELCSAIDVEGQVVTVDTLGRQWDRDSTVAESSGTALSDIGSEDMAMAEDVESGLDSELDE